MSTKDNQSAAVSKPGIKWEMLLAIMAVLISVLTLVVYIYQSNLMKQQQKMSVWPYLSFGPSWGEDYLKLSLINKGIGPAIIKDFQFTMNGSELSGVQEIMTSLPDSLQTAFTYSSVWKGQVIMAGETISLLTINDPKTIQHLLELFKTQDFLLEICYSSVYGDTWVASGMSVAEGNCGE